MFSNPDFQIDQESEEFRLINPVMSKLDKARKKRDEKYNLTKQFTEVEVMFKVKKYLIFLRGCVSACFVTSHLLYIYP